MYLHTYHFVGCVNYQVRFRYQCLINNSFYCHVFSMAFYLPRYPILHLMTVKYVPHFWQVICIFNWECIFCSQLLTAAEALLWIWQTHIAYSVQLLQHFQSLLTYNLNYELCILLNSETFWAMKYVRVPFIMGYSQRTVSWRPGFDGQNRELITTCSFIRIVTCMIAFLWLPILYAFENMTIWGREDMCKTWPRD